MFGADVGVLSQIVLLLLLTAVISPTLSVSGQSDGGDERFRRPDPLRNFRYYNGGFDVRDKHYWASTAFTGVHGYVVAGVWSISVVCLGVFLALNGSRGILYSSICSTRRRLDRYYVPLLLLVLFFVLLSMAATGMVIAANQSSRNKSVELKDTIAKAGDDVRRTIRTVIESMTRIQYLLRPYDQKTTQILNVTTHHLGKESREIQQFVQEKGRFIDLAIQTSYISHLMVASINLSVLFLAFAPLLLHWQPGFIMVIFVCSILTSLCWILTGFDFFLHTFMGDVCSSFKGFIQNSQNSTLSSMLPCMDSLHSDQTLDEISLIIHTFIGQLNSKIAEATHSYTFKQSKDVSESGLICDPFLGSHNLSYIPRNCPIGTIPIGEFPNIIGRFICRDSDSPESCRTTGKFIPEASYGKAQAYSSSAQGMLDIFPDLQSLTRCVIVKDTLSGIISNQCKPLRVSMYRLWASMLALSVFMAVLVLLCLVKAFQRKGKNFICGSI